MTVQVGQATIASSTNDEVAIQFTGQGLSDTTAFTATLTFDDGSSTVELSGTGTTLTLTSDNATAFNNASKVVIIIKVGDYTSAELTLK